MKSTEETKKKLLNAIEQSNATNQLISEHLGRISQSIVKLTVLLEDALSSKRSSFENSYAQVEPTFGIKQQDLEIEFLTRVIDMYRDEAKRKALLQKKRKSSKLIQAEIQKISKKFFAKHLGSNYEVRSYEEAYIVISKKQYKSFVDIAMIRVVNDLGFMRNKLKEYALEPMINHAKGLGIPKEHTFLIVLTVVNSLVQEDVRNVLHAPNLNNKELYNLTNPSATSKIKEYLLAENGLLGRENFLYEDNDASKHVKFILRASNPNAEGDAMYLDPSYSIEWSRNMWYEKPFSALLETIKAM